MSKARRNVAANVRFEANDSGYSVTGEFDYDAASIVLAAGAEYLSASVAGGVAEVVMDVEGLRAESGSLVVALLLAWLRHATSIELSLRFTGLASSYREVVSVSGLADTLPLETVSETALAQL